MIAPLVDDLRLASRDPGAAGPMDPVTYNRVEQRCQIAALHRHQVPLGTMAWLVNRDPSTIRRWIARVEAGRDLRDRKRSGRPPLFTEDIVLKTIALHCQVSPVPGCNSWSLRWAEKYLEAHPEITGAAVSRSTIQRFLKSHALAPHRRKYFLQITDPDFFPKMKHLVDLYLHPPAYLFNFDECTAIQAKTPITPDLPAEAERPVYQEFEYQRNGTTDLMAFLRPQTGQVFGRCTPDHTAQTLSRVFTEHVRTQPENAQLHYVFDNLSTHFHDRFCHAVGQLSGSVYTPLKTGWERRAWLQSEEKRIVIHFTPFHGSWLNMIEIWFGILSQKCLKGGSFESVSALANAIESFIETWNNHYAHPFTWTYTGAGLHQKAVRRFSKVLLIESKQTDCKFLTSQLRLIGNIAKEYRRSVPDQDWKQFVDLLDAKRDYINHIVARDEKVRRRTTAQKALTEITALLN